MAAVIVMAKAPQKVTRVTPLMMFAPPTRAATPPNRARNKSELPETTTMILDAGIVNTNRTGKIPPTVKDAAETSAA